MLRTAFGLLLASTYLAGCSFIPWGRQAPAPTSTPVETSQKGGGYYLDDGPGDNPPANLAAIPDAVPKEEPLHRHANKPYVAMGKTYTPDISGKPYKQQGLASWYGRRYHGKPTASGEIYDMYGMTAAHPTLPIPSYVKVTNLKNGRSVVLKVNDRGPFKDDRLIDISYTAAWRLDILGGVTPVQVERIFPEEVPSSIVKVTRVEEPVFEQATLPPPAPMPGQAANDAPQSGEPLTGGRYLQIGAFGNPAAADDLVAQIRRKLDVRVRRVRTGGLYKVHVGPFSDAEEMNQAIRRIQDALGIRPYKIDI